MLWFFSDLNFKDIWLSFLTCFFQLSDTQKYHFRDDIITSGDTLLSFQHSNCSPSLTHSPWHFIWCV